MLSIFKLTSKWTIGPKSGASTVFYFSPFPDFFSFFLLVFLNFPTCLYRYAVNYCLPYWMEFTNCLLSPVFIIFLLFSPLLLFCLSLSFIFFPDSIFFIFLPFDFIHFILFPSLMNFPSYSFFLIFFNFPSLLAYHLGEVDTLNPVRSEKLSTAHWDRSWMGYLPGSNPGVCRSGIHVWPTNST